MAKVRIVDIEPLDNAANLVHQRDQLAGEAGRPSMQYRSSSRWR